MVKHFLFPMKDYIGVVGCGVFLLFLDIFIRFHSLFLPLFIATLRYLFIVQNGWMKARGISIVVSRVVALQILVPVCLTLILQFPAFDVPQGPFNHCIGRFEVYFNPLHPGTTLQVAFQFKYLAVFSFYYFDKLYKLIESFRKLDFKIFGF